MTGSDGWKWLKSKNSKILNFQIAAEPYIHQEPIAVAAPVVAPAPAIAYAAAAPVAAPVAAYNYAAAPVAAYNYAAAPGWSSGS